MKIITWRSRILSPLLTKKHLCLEYGTKMGANISIQMCLPVMVEELSDCSLFIPDVESMREHLGLRALWVSYAAWGVR